MERYKLYIFLNAYAIPHELAEHIRSKFLIKEGKTVLWLYAPDYAQNPENSIERIKAITGMNIIEQSSSHGSFVYKDSCVINNIAPPHFSIEDPSTTPLAYYSDGTVACAEKTTDKVRTIYCACPNPPSVFLRDMADKSGCFLYSHEDIVYTYVNNTIIGVYNATDTDAKIRILTDGRYVNVFKNEYFVSKEGILQLPLRPLRAYMLIAQDE